jgi:hypothetical protein
MRSISNNLCGRDLFEPVGFIRHEGVSPILEQHEKRRWHLRPISLRRDMMLLPTAVSDPAMIGIASRLTTPPVVLDTERFTFAHRMSRAVRRARAAVD